MPEEIISGPARQSRSAGNMAYQPYFADRNGLKNRTNSAQNGILTSPKSPIKQTNQNRLTNGTLPHPEKPISTANGFDVVTSTKSKKSKAKPLSIPSSPTTNKHMMVPDPQASRVGKYTIIRTLGRGNFAQVKLAIHVTTGREVAIKMIDKTSLNENCRIKLAREVRVLKTLTHPNIVRLYEVIETTRHVYLVMEYAKNGEVFEHLLKAGRMAETRVRAIFRQLFSAVEYCHQKNIVHRDLKAENLLLDENNNLKLADFGFANTFDAGNTLDTFCGSPPYAAPELLCGQKYHGPEVDVWALGVILYMLVCGQLPFEAFTLKELHSRVLSGKYRIPFYMSGACEGMLKKMLVLNPNKRATLKELMNEKWINVGYESEPLRPFVEPKQDYSDPIRRAIMNELGFNPEDLKDAFENRRFNNITATYLLLADTETRHRLTRKLQNEYETPKSLSQYNLSSEPEVESSDDDPRCDLRQLSHSAITSNGRANLELRGRGSWGTGSLRDQDPQPASNLYSKPNKQLCRPSLNLPSLIATSDKSEWAFPRFPVNMTLTANESHEARSGTGRSKPQTDGDSKPDQSDAEMDSVAAPTPNGLRRFRTPSLERKPERQSDVNGNGSAQGNMKNSDSTMLISKPHGNRTDPVTRRDLTQPAPGWRSRSIVIVSDENHTNGHKTLDTFRKLPRVISPAESKITAVSNRPVDLLNPGERDRYLRGSDRPMSSPPVQKISLRRHRTYTEGDSARSDNRPGDPSDTTDKKPVLSRWAHILSPGRGNPDGLENSRDIEDTKNQSIIIISDKNEPSAVNGTRVLTPTVKLSPNARRPLLRQRSERTDTQFTQSGINGSVDENRQTPAVRTDRMPKWRRYTAEFPSSPDKPPTSPPHTFVAAAGFSSGSADRPYPSATEPDSKYPPEPIYATVVRPVHDARPTTTIDYGAGRKDTVVVLNHGQHHIPNGKSNSPISSTHFYRKPNGETSKDFPDHSPHKSNAYTEWNANQPLLVFSTPKNELASQNRTTVINGSALNGAHDAPQSARADSAGTQLLVLNGQPPTSASNRSSTVVDRPVPTLRKPWATTRLYGNPNHYRDWDLNNGSNHTGLHRSQSHRDTPESTRPSAMLTSSRAAPDFTRVYTNGRESSQNINHVLDSDRQPRTSRTEPQGFRQNVLPRWQSPITPNSSATNRPLSGTTMVPRQQNWSFGIAVQGRNAQVLMLSTLRILEDNQIDYVYLNPYRLMCTYSQRNRSGGVQKSGSAGPADTVTWEMEVVQLPQMKTYGVRFKYISGATAQYRTLEKAIINEFPKTAD